MGEVIHIPTQMSTRVRFAIITLARREAREAVKRKLRAEGRIKLAYLSASEITQLADAHLRAHAAELLAQAEASSIVRNLQHSLNRRIAVRKSGAKRRGQSGLNGVLGSKNRFGN
jgi:hypothetical protein